MKAKLLSIALGLLTLNVRAFVLTPISMSLEPRGYKSSATVRIDNPSSNRIAFKLTVAERDPDINDRETNPRITNLFTLFPPQGVIAPGKSQNVRVLWKGSPNLTNELCCRLIAEQLPVDFTPDETSSQIKILVRYMAALYVAPKNVKAVLKVERVARSTNETYVVEVVNNGNCHKHLINPRLTLKDSKGISFPVPTKALINLVNQNILPGRSRRFSVPLPDKTDPTFSGELTVDDE